MGDRPGINPEVMQKMAAGLSPQGAGGTTVDAGAIIKNLDGQFINKYILHLEGGRNILQTYLDELMAIEKRLSKATPGVRKALGEDLLIAKREAIEETLKKLTAHQTSTLDRIRG